MLAAGPEMILDHIRDAAELAAHIHAVVAGVGGAAGRRIAMGIGDVADAEIAPTGGGIHQATRVGIGIAHHEVAAHGVSGSGIGILSPTFVVRNPDADGGVLLEGSDDVFAFFVEDLLQFGLGAETAVIAAAGHVLPHD